MRSPRDKPVKKVWFVRSHFMRRTQSVKTLLPPLHGSNRLLFWSPCSFSLLTLFPSTEGSKKMSKKTAAPLRYSDAVEAAMSAVCPAKDSFDDPNFDAVEYMNARFPSEGSLKQLPAFVSELESELSTTEANLVSAVRQQAVPAPAGADDESTTSCSDDADDDADGHGNGEDDDVDDNVLRWDHEDRIGGGTDPSHAALRHGRRKRRPTNRAAVNHAMGADTFMDSARQTVAQLQLRVKSIQQKASETDDMMGDVCRDIRRLDVARSNLAASIKQMKHLQLLIVSLQMVHQQLEQVKFNDMDSHIRQIHLYLAKFERLKDSVPKIRELRDKAQGICTRVEFVIKNSVINDLSRRPGHLSIKNLTAAETEKLRQACLVVDALGSDSVAKIRQQYIDGQLTQLDAMFARGTEDAKLERVERRYARFRALLDASDDVFTHTFPANWFVPHEMCLEFCLRTQKELASLLSDQAAKVDPFLLSVVVPKTIDAEKDLTMRMLSLDEATASSSSPPPSTVDGREVGSKAAATTMLRTSSNYKYLGLIARVFEPYMVVLVSHEHYTMQQILRQLALPPASSGVAATAGNALITHITTQPPKTVEDLRILVVAQELFLFVQESLRRVLLFDHRSTFLDLSDVWLKNLETYAAYLEQLVKVVAQCTAASGLVQTHQMIGGSAPLPSPAATSGNALLHAPGPMNSSSGGAIGQAASSILSALTSAGSGGVGTSAAASGQAAAVSVLSGAPTTAVILAQVTLLTTSSQIQFALLHAASILNTCDFCAKGTTELSENVEDRLKRMFASSSSQSGGRHGAHSHHRGGGGHHEGPIGPTASSQSAASTASTVDQAMSLLPFGDVSDHFTRVFLGTISLIIEPLCNVIALLSSEYMSAALKDAAAQAATESADGPAGAPLGMGHGVQSTAGLQQLGDAFRASLWKVISHQVTLWAESLQPEHLLVVLRRVPASICQLISKCLMSRKEFRGKVRDAGMTQLRADFAEVEQVVLRVTTLPVVVTAAFGGDEGGGLPQRRDGGQVSGFENLFTKGTKREFHKLLNLFKVLECDVRVLPQLYHELTPTEDRSVAQCTKLLELKGVRPEDMRGLVAILKRLGVPDFGRLDGAAGSAPRTSSSTDASHGATSAQAANSGVGKNILAALGVGANHNGQTSAGGGGGGHHSTTGATGGPSDVGGVPPAGDGTAASSVSLKARFQAVAAALGRQQQNATGKASN